MAYTQFGNASTAGRLSNADSKTEYGVFMHRDEICAPAKKYNKTAGQVALRWALQRGTVIMPKTEKVERLDENLNIFDF